MKFVNAVLFGSIINNHFKKGVTWRAKKMLELVHTDVCGLMQTPSPGILFSLLMIIVA
jgi:hypothetical protein